MVRDKDSRLPLFETKAMKGRFAYQLYAISVFLGVLLIWIYRFSHFPATGEPLGRWAWTIMSAAELWFSFYWFLSQFVRWNPIYRSTFKDRLSSRQILLPGVDVFVCTADRSIEPPIMVVNTVLSVMAYDYPPENLNVYVSDDDGGSELMFYALLEASGFAKHWSPFCRRFQIEPRSPGAYFSTNQEPNELLHDPSLTHDWLFIKKQYEDMQYRIETAARLGRVSEETRELHKGFHEWDSNTTSSDHQAIVQILIDGRDSTSMDAEGQMLPMLVYVAREKRTPYHHNFKAGALNALIRVSSMISNGSIILNVDCDVYSNNSESVREALCCFMDEEKGHEIAYVQFPQNCYNLTKNDMYASCFRVPNELEMGGLDANGGPCYIGSGCFHRRDALCGAKYGNIFQVESETENTRNEREMGSVVVLEERCKSLASCTHEENTEWGKEIGLIDGFPSEDIVTGLAIQCRGWKSAYLNPEKKAFIGVAPTTLLQVLVQHSRWSEGHFNLLFSRYCPFLLYRYKRIPFTLQMSYALYLLWAPNCLPTLCYVTVPQLCLLKHVSLFPEISSFWILPFMYVIISQYIYSLAEFISCGGTIQGWWNEQRMWLFKRTTSYFIASMETVLKQFGFSKSGFIVTPKVVDEDVLQRYKKEVMEFGDNSVMFIVLGSIAILNLFSLFWSFKTAAMEHLALQIGVCGVVVLINLPVYEGLFLRWDKGKMPISVTCKSVMLALLACMFALY